MDAKPKVHIKADQRMEGYNITKYLKHVSYMYTGIHVVSRSCFFLTVALCPLELVRHGPYSRYLWRPELVPLLTLKLKHGM